eukprot:g2133.t1
MMRSGALATIWLVAFATFTAAQEAQLAVANTDTFEGTNDVNFMVVDHDFIYSATDEAIVRTSREDSNDSTTMMLQQLISDAATVGLRTQDFTFQEYQAQEPTAMAQDADNIYVTLGVGNGKYTCLKIGKTTSRIDGHYEFSGAQDIPYSMVVEGQYIYTGMNSYPGQVVKINTATMAVVGSALALGNGENDVRLLVSDGSKLYAFTHTSPSIVVKIDVATFAVTQSLTLQAGEDDILAATVDKKSDSLFAACFTSPGRIVKIDRVSMTRTAAKVLTTETNPDAIVNDHNDLFVGFYEAPGQILKLDKSDLAIKQTLALGNTQDHVTTLYGIGTELYAGLATTPAQVVQLSGFEAPIECVVGSWTHWGDCSSTCAGGSESRTRAIVVQPQHGSDPCPALAETRECNADVVCPVDCGGGKTWTTTGVTPDRTCNNQNPVVTGSNIPRCQCPDDRPMVHPDTGICVAQDACHKNTTICDDIECHFTDGRVQISLIDGKQPNMEKGFICHHTEGRLGGCSCLCYDNHLEHLWEDMPGTIDCKKNVYGEEECLMGG